MDEIWYATEPCGCATGAADGDMTEYADVDDYARMCVSCHRHFDAARRRLTGRRTSPKRR